MKVSPHSQCFAIFTAVALALCFQAPLSAEKKPAPSAKSKKTTAEEEKLREKAKDLLNRGIILHNQGKHAEAEKAWRAELAIRQRLAGPEDRFTLGCRNNLAILQYERGKHAEAEKEFRAVLAIRERLLGANDHQTLASRLTIAEVLLAQGKNAEAEKDYRALLADMQRTELEQPSQIDDCRLGLANAMQAEGRHAEAEKEYREILKDTLFAPGELKDTLPDPGEAVLAAQINLARLLTAQGRHAEAEREYRVMLSYREKEEQNYQEFRAMAFRIVGGQEVPVEDRKKPAVFISNYDLALCLKVQGKTKEALPLMQRAEAGLNKTLRPEHPRSKQAKQEREDIEAEIKKQQADGK